jgi:hypothetical protein
MEQAEERKPQEVQEELGNNLLLRIREDLDMEEIPIRIVSEIMDTEGEEDIMEEVQVVLQVAVFMVVQEVPLSSRDIQGL